MVLTMTRRGPFGAGLRGRELGLSIGVNSVAQRLHAVLRYYASDMILCLVSNAAYLVLPNACSCCATLFTPIDKPNYLLLKPAPNGPLRVMVKTIKGLSPSASESENGVIFLVAQEVCPIITTLLELGHPQPSTGTPLETDNSTATDILTTEVRMKH